MKRTHLIPVLVLTALTALFAFWQGGQEGTSADTVQIYISQSHGIRVLSENPVTAFPGETVRFQIAVEDGYLFESAPEGSFDGQTYTLTAERDKTLYLSTRKYCNIEIENSGGGTARLASDALPLEGDVAEIFLMPDEHYEAAAVFVGEREYPVPADNVFRFTVRGDALVRTQFQGETLSFSTISGNLGEVRIEGGSDTYHYGDNVRLTAQSVSEFVSFQGWSAGGYLSEGGRLLSEDSSMDYTIEDHAMVFANFEDERSFAVHYDPAGGSSAIANDDRYSPGQYINLRIDDSSLMREGYVLTGYNESPDLTGKQHALGAMILMPAADLTLYATWEEETNVDYLRYEFGESSVTITGLSDAGRVAALTKLVIPRRIGGLQTVSVSSSAFQGIDTLESVIVPVGVQTIGEYAFADNANLQTVYLPETLTALPGTAFSNCPAWERMRVLASLDRVFDYDYDSVLSEKYLRLVTSEGNRLILAGGSGLSFGINSAMIKEAFPAYTVVNFSGSAYAGVRPMLDILRAQVREGDIVVYIPEYYSYMYGYDETAGILNWQYLESNYDILEDISVQNNPVLFSNYLLYLQEKRSFLPDKKQNPKSAYARGGFNQAGDLTTPRTNQLGEGLYLPNEAALKEAGIARYNELSRELAARGARCLFSFPALPDGGLTRQQLKERTDPFLRELANMLDADAITLISDPADYGFANELFFDNEYHLTNEGAVERTTRLIEDLRKVIG